MKIEDLCRGLIHSAFHDYAGARCCFLNMCVIPGYLLAQQAVEKLLKAGAYAGAGEIIKLERGSSHDLLAWKTKATDYAPSSLELDDHTALLQRLSDAFNGKYPDASISPGIRGSNELVEIDEVVIKLFLNSPFPAAFCRSFELAGLGVIIEPESVWVTCENTGFINAAESLSADIGKVLLQGIRCASESHVIPKLGESSGPSVYLVLKNTAA